MSWLLKFINLLINLYIFVVFIRVLLTWIPVYEPRGRIFRYLFLLVDPILERIRRYVRTEVGNFDISPLVLFLVLFLVKIILNNLLMGGF